MKRAAITASYNQQETRRREKDQITSSSKDPACTMAGATNWISIGQVVRESDATIYAFLPWKQVAADAGLLESLSEQIFTGHFQCKIRRRASLSGWPVRQREIRRRRLGPSFVVIHGGNYAH